MKVFVALNSVPDYHAGAPTFKSVHETLAGAVNSLYPNQENFQSTFRKWPGRLVWEGPDGFGMVKLVEVLP